MVGLFLDGQAKAAGATKRKAKEWAVQQAAYAATLETLDLEEELEESNSTLSDKIWKTRGLASLKAPSVYSTALRTVIVNMKDNSFNNLRLLFALPLPSLSREGLTLLPSLLNR